MANICSNSVVITGDKESLKKLRDLINRQDKSLFGETGICDHLESTSAPDIAYGLEDDLPLDGDGFLGLCITSKWAPPEKDFENLTKAFPKLNIEVTYEESAMAVYGKLVYEGGTKVLDQHQEEFDYLMENHEDFADTVEAIKELPYEEFRKDYIVDTEYKDSPEWMCYGHILEPLLLKRTRRADLPLLIGQLDYCDELLEQRLKNRKSKTSRTPIARHVTVTGCGGW